MFDVVTAGENSVDLLCVSQSFPAPDSKQPLLESRVLPGGQAASAAVGCARLGLRACYVGVVGDDAGGESVRECLKRENVVARLVTRAGVATRSAVILVDTAGHRSVLSSRDARLDADDREFANEVFTNARMVLVDGSDLRLARRAADAARAARVPTMCDLDDATPEAQGLLELIDIVIVPAAFVRAATGEAGLTAGLRHLARRCGAEVLVATDGENGATAVAEGQVVETPAEPVRVVDSTGAGDAFRAGFAAAWLGSAGGSRDLVEIMRFATRVAAMTCRDYGATAALPTRAEMRRTGEDRV